jgi:PEP-CTERM motif
MLFNVRNTMKKALLTVALALPLLASAQNLLTNGSFENGLTAWTPVQTAGTIYPVATIAYGALPGAFGEVVPVDDNAFSLSPDAAGLSGAYFVDDMTTQTLSQQFTVVDGGLYNVGFSLYVPANGAANPGAALFAADFTIANTGTVSVQTLPITTWLDASGTFYIDPGVYTASFTFTTMGGLSADAVIDRAYVAAVPEPSTYAMLIAGLGVMGAIAARRRRD